MTITATYLRSTLPTTSLFHPLTNAELEDFSSICRDEHIPPDHDLYVQGGISDDVSLILEGAARIHVRPAEGQRTIYRYTSAGDLLNYSAIIDKGASFYSARTLWESRIARINGRDMVAFLMRYPHLTMSFYQEAVQRFRGSHFFYSNGIALDFGKRLANQILDLKRGGADSQNIIPIIKTQLENDPDDDRPAQVDRQLSLWAGEGVIDIQDGCLQILDQAYLRNLADNINLNAQQS